jgi:lysophospholipase L1-like esterase
VKLTPEKAAWSGKTIKYIADNVSPSLAMRPNLILVHAGTNDMNSNGNISTEGNDPQSAADRLGELVDQMVTACPDATILVAMILNIIDTGSCSSYTAQETRLQQFQSLIPGIVSSRAAVGKHVLAVDFTKLPTSLVHSDDCIHPKNAGYKLMGDYWYDFLHQVPKAWINAPIGAGPKLPNTTEPLQVMARTVSGQKSSAARSSSSVMSGSTAVSGATFLNVSWMVLMLSWTVAAVGVTAK